MTPGVHVDASAHRPGHADEDVQAGEARLGGTAGGERRGQPGANGPVVPVPVQAIETLSQPDDQGVQPVVRQQDVRAEPDGKPGHARFGGQRQRGADILRRGRQQDGGRAADSVGRVSPHRLRLTDLPGHPAAQRLDEFRIPSGHPVHSGDISRASACHSWSARTSPARLRSAMMASHAAEAAESVVVYGTRC